MLEEKLSNTVSQQIIFVQGLTRIVRLSAALAWLDTKLRYRRTKLGPFWVTVSTGAMVLAVGIVYGQIFGAPTGVGNAGYIAFLGVGLIFWQFISATAIEGCSVFISSGPLIKALEVPILVHVFRMVSRNIILLAHNAIIILLLWMFIQWGLTWHSLLAIPGLLLVTAAALGAAMTLSVLCTRFRDISPIVQTLLQLMFLLTPIIWPPSALQKTRASLLLDINPMYYLIEVVRAPLLGESTSLSLWAIAGIISLSSLAIGIVLYTRFRRRIAYWL